MVRPADESETLEQVRARLANIAHRHALLENAFADLVARHAQLETDFLALCGNITRVVEISDQSKNIVDNHTMRIPNTERAVQLVADFVKYAPESDTTTDRPLPRCVRTAGCSLAFSHGGPCPDARD